MAFVLQGALVKSSLAALINIRRRVGYRKAADVALGELLAVLATENYVVDEKDIRDDFRNRFINIEKQYKSLGRRWGDFPPGVEEQRTCFELVVDEAGPSSKQPRTSLEGRPSGSFDQVSLRQKRRRLKVYDGTESCELLAACKKASKTEGQQGAVDVLSRLQRSPTRGGTMTKIIEKGSAEAFTPEQALSMMYKYNWGRATYESLRNDCARIGHSIFPSYYQITKCKEANLLPKEDILISDDVIECRLQALMDNSVHSLAKFVDIKPGKYKLICKWGGDGSSGHSMYKQQMGNSSGGDTSIYMMCLVIIRLEDSEGNIIWQNPTPGSKNSCRPIKIIYAKESKELVRDETAKIDEQIKQLKPTQVGDAEISHELHMTMVDMKVINHITGTDGQCNCYICGAKPSDMNRIIKGTSTKNFVANEDTYKFGLSTLHAKINFFTCFLHISYKLELRAPIVTKAIKPIVDLKKRKIQKLFSEKMSLNVDIPISSAGNTNDGNTARKFFKNAHLSAEITGIDVNLLKMCDKILRAMTSGIEILDGPFRKLCGEAAALYVELYDFHKMPVTMHKILMHGADVIRYFHYPIGLFGEDAQETRTKDLKKFRLERTRKTSRKACNMDLARTSLLSSNPYLQHLSAGKPKSGYKIDNDLIGLLKLDEVDKEVLVDKEQDDDSDFYGYNE